MTALGNDNTNTPNARMTTTFSIDAPAYQQLVELARRNDRSVVAEARVAIRRHLKAEAAREDTE